MSSPSNIKPCLFNEEDLLAAVPYLINSETGVPNLTSTEQVSPQTKTNPKYRKRLEFSHSRESSGSLQIFGSYDQLTLKDAGEDPPKIELFHDYFPQPKIKNNSNHMNEAMRKLNNQREGTLEWEMALKELIEAKIKNNESTEREKSDEGSPVLLKSHTFIIQRPPASYCEICLGHLLPWLYSCYICTDCNLACHVGCISKLSRRCVAPQVRDTYSYPSEICPDRGLHTQNYECAECYSPISYQNSRNIPRICDYTGKYYCCKCHWNDQSINPVRVLLNWDMNKYPICRSSLQILYLLRNKPMIDHNSSMYPPLSSPALRMYEIMAYRRGIVAMRYYLWQCEDSSIVLQQLEESGDQMHDMRHVLDGSRLLTFSDVLALQQGVLLSRLVHVFSLFSNHIKLSCKKCRLNGKRCYVCDKKELIYRFDASAVFCSCGSAFHKSCVTNSQYPCCK